MISKIRKSIISVPYRVKVQTDTKNACRPIWTYVTDEALIPFFGDLGFASPEKAADPYKPYGGGCEGKRRVRRGGSQEGGGKETEARWAEESRKRRGRQRAGNFYFF
jgi:hypothetical protein